MLFLGTMVMRPEVGELRGFAPDYTVIDLPGFRADPERHGCRSETVIAVSRADKLILIGGTAYAGEMKKSVFGLLNYLLPPKGIMPMHRSEEHTSELQSLMRISYAVFCLKKKNQTKYKK